MKNTKREIGFVAFPEQHMKRNDKRRNLRRRLLSILLARSQTMIMIARNAFPVFRARRQ